MTVGLVSSEAVRLGSGPELSHWYLNIFPRFRFPLFYKDTQSERMRASNNHFILIISVRSPYPKRVPFGGSEDRTPTDWRGEEQAAVTNSPLV